MSRSRRVGLACAGTILVLSALYRARGDAQADIPPTNNLPNPYRSVGTWGQLPEGRAWGATNAIEADRGGTIWVADRCGGNTCLGSDVAPILHFDPSGKLLNSFGAGLFAMPHGLCLDPDGSVWATDSGPFNRSEPTQGKGFQVFKFSRDGKVLMTLGKPGVSREGTDTFIAPSDCAIARNGDLFVTDGHGKGGGRLVKFSKQGTFIKVLASSGSGPGEVDDPHGIALDSRGRLFVADSGNDRVQIFDQEGHSLAMWKQFSLPRGVTIDKNDTLYVADALSNIPAGGVARHPGWTNGIRIGSAKDGTVVALIDFADPFATPEGVAVDSMGNVYGARVSKKGVEKYVKK